MCQRNLEYVVWQNAVYDRNLERCNTKKHLTSSWTKLVCPKSTLIYFYTWAQKLTPSVMSSPSTRNPPIHLFDCALSKRTTQFMASDLVWGCYVIVVMDRTVACCDNDEGYHAGRQQTYDWCLLVMYEASIDGLCPFFRFPSNCVQQNYMSRLNNVNVVVWVQFGKKHGHANLYNTYVT
jgi:hypothetical protein